MTGAALFVAEGISKRYKIRTQKSLSLGFLRGNRAREHWALRELDLDVLPGEVVAVIGRNGAGKSTLLKVAAGVTTPTTGTLRRPRRIAPLIEVGAGFHPDLTGRENIEVNARLLGVGAAEIRRSFDDIVDFAELRASIDQPVRQYSSGMFMRLGFAVAIHTRPDLLIVDEVLAVGDLPFQVRCLDRIREMRADGVGVLFVSHNLTAVLSLSDRALLLERGEVRARGSASDVVGAYHQSLSASPVENVMADESGATGALEMSELQVRDEHGNDNMLWEPGQRAVVTMRMEAKTATPEGLIGFRFIKDGAGMVARWVSPEATPIPPMQPGESVDLEFELSLNFAEGGYLLDIGVGPRDMSTFMLLQNSVYRFGVGSRAGGTGIVDVSPRLTVRPVG